MKRMWLTVLILGVGMSWADRFEDGVDAYGRGDYATALKSFQLLAEQGNAKAQHNLGVMHAKGEGVTPDHAAAANWYRLAAEQGDAEAQTKLGVLYNGGQGVKLDYAEAARWYRSAAAQGHAQAQYNLGVLHAEGQGVGQDYAEAAKWYRLAVAQRHALAQRILACCMTEARVCGGITRKPPSGIGWRRRRTLPWRNTTWACCMSWGKAWRRNMSGHTHG